MGGSGGGFFHSGDAPMDLSKRVQEAERKLYNAEFENAVANHIDSLLFDFNNRNADLIADYINQIKNALEKDIDGTVNVLFGGSVSKHTYVDGLSDVDALVLIDRTELAEKSPEQIKDYFLERINARMPQQEAKKGKLAVTVNFSEVEIQLLPALRTKSGFQIPDKSGMNWISIFPGHFKNQLTTINKAQGMKVVPVIKLAKSIFSTLPENRQLSGYHTESLAIEIFKNYDGPKNTKAMLTHFFLAAPDKILNPIKDLTKQSQHVDSYLGQKDSFERMLIADTVGRIGRKMQVADAAQSLNVWKSVLEGV